MIEQFYAASVAIHINGLSARFYRREKMDLKNGNIELLGTVFGKDTTPEDILKNTAIRASSANKPNSKIESFYADGAIVDGIKFNVTIFFISRKIDSIHMIPIDLEMPDPGYPNKEYQELRKKTCDAFLLRALGEPTDKDETFTAYDYDWGEIVSVAFYEERHDPYTGGYIDIIYNRKG